VLLQIPRYGDESLPSFIVRLAQYNGYEGPQVLLRRCFAGLELLPSEQHLSRVRSTPALERLADLSGQHPDDVLAATAHVYAPLLMPPNHAPLNSSADPSQSVLTRDLCRAHIRPEHTAQFCPRCLMEQPYHRRRWLPLAVTICLRHRHFLIARCPQCHRPTPIHAIVLARCLHCWADLTHACATPVPAAHLPAQRILQAWFAGQTLPMGLGAGPLLTEPPAVLFQMVDAIATEDARQFWSELVRSSAGTSGNLTKGRRYILPPAVLATGYRRGIDAFYHWPHNLSAAVKQLPAVSPAAFGFGGRTLFAALGAYWRGEATPSAAYAFVLPALERYGLDRLAVQRVGLITARLEMSPVLLLRLLQLGATGEGPQPTLQPAQTRRSLATVVAIRRRWHEPLPLPVVARWLDMSVADMHALVNLNMLQAAPEAAGMDGLRIRPQNIEAWLDLLHSHVRMLTSFMLRHGGPPLSTTELILRPTRSGRWWPFWRRKAQRPRGSRPRMQHEDANGALLSVFASSWRIGGRHPTRVCERYGLAPSAAAALAARL